MKDESLFYPEDGGRRFLQNAGTYVQTTWHHIPSGGDLRMFLQVSEMCLKYTVPETGLSDPFQIRQMFHGARWKCVIRWLSVPM
jgi:hypothetical protein